MSLRPTLDQSSVNSSGYESNVLLGQHNASTNVTQKLCLYARSAVKSSERASIAISQSSERSTSTPTRSDWLSRPPRGTVGPALRPSPQEQTGKAPCFSSPITALPSRVESNIWPSDTMVGRPDLWSGPHQLILPNVRGCFTSAFLSPFGKAVSAAISSSSSGSSGSICSRNRSRNSRSFVLQ